MSQHHFTARPLDAHHTTVWQALRLQGVRGFPLGFLITESEAQQTTPERAAIILDAGNIWGVFDTQKSDETLVGFCGYGPHKLERIKHRAEIGPFFVAPSHHGTGAATTLMNAIIDSAHSNGLEQLELFVDTENHRAIRFYERMGFEHIATHPNGVKIDGKPHDDHFYILSLTS